MPSRTRPFVTACTTTENPSPIRICSPHFLLRTNMLIPFHGETARLATHATSEPIVHRSQVGVCEIVNTWGLLPGFRSVMSTCGGPRS